MTPVSAGPVTVRTSEGARMILTVLIAVLLLVLVAAPASFGRTRRPPLDPRGGEGDRCRGHLASTLLRPGRSGTRSGSDSDDGGSD